MRWAYVLSASSAAVANGTPNCVRSSTTRAVACVWRRLIAMTVPGLTLCLAAHLRTLRSASATIAASRSVSTRDAMHDTGCYSDRASARSGCLTSFIW